METSLTTARSLLIVILILAVAPYFVRLGASSLWDSNEAFYAETPREMIESADYVNPTFNYRPRLNKPPLSYWVVVPFYKLFGVSEAAERLPIVLAAMIMIATAYSLGRILFSREGGLLAAICLAIAPRFLMFSRRIMIDVYLAMFMALALLMFVLAEKYVEHRRRYLILTYVCLALGVITKGPVAVVLAALVMLIYLATERSFGKLREMMLPAGLVIIAAIVLPWYIAIYLQHGWAHIETFIMKDNLSRFAEPVWGPRRGFLFYIPVVMGDLFPWSVFLLPLGWLGLQGLWRRLRVRDAYRAGCAELNATALMWIWIAVIVAFFSFSRSKEDLYILPMYPAAAALIGGLLAKFVGGESRGRRFVLTMILVLAIIIASAGASILLLFKQSYELAGAGLIGYAAIAGGLVAAGAALMKKHLASVLAIALTLVACNWAFVARTLPDFERYKPVRPLCEVIEREADDGALVGYYKSAFPSMTFYLRRPIFEYYEQDDIVTALSSNDTVFCLMAESDYQTIKALLPPRTRVLASHPIFQVKLRGILERVELPRVVLISNKGGTEFAQ